MPEENQRITREHLPGLLLARAIWERGPSLYFPPALKTATDQARACSLEMKTHCVELYRDAPELHEVVLASEALAACAARDARIVELESGQSADMFLTLTGEITQLRAELAAIKAREPAVYIPVNREFLEEIADSLDYGVRDVRDKVRSLLAAPVSEAKAQGLVMPEPDFYWVEADEGSWNSPEEWAQDYYDYNGEKPESVSFSCAIELPVREYDSFEFDANGSCVSCRLVNPEVARLTAAPVQQVSVPPFAQKVIRKLERFQECMDDGQGADIGRHWFDLLTQLGLLNRVQRSPALWEITQQGEDLLVAAPAAPAADAWIPVSERLPGDQGHDSEEVLCFLNGHCSLLDNECRQGGGWGIRLGYYDADIGTFRVFGRPESHVTHWMPLPAAPIKIEASRHDQ